MQTSSSSLWRRLVAALLVGAIVTALALWVTWQTGRESRNVRAAQTWTQVQIKAAMQVLEAHRIEKGGYPARLSDINPTDTRIAGRVDGDAILDGWKRPLHYSVDGSSFLLLSLGRDGEPGGVGIDYDLSSRELNPPDSLPTLSQFLFDRSIKTAGMIPMCGLSGLFAFMATLWSARSSTKQTERKSYSALLQYVFTIVAAAALGSVLALLHQPSGH